MWMFGLKTRKKTKTSGPFLGNYLSMIYKLIAVVRMSTTFNMHAAIPYLPAFSGYCEYVKYPILCSAQNRRDIVMLLLLRVKKYKNTF